ncbi:MAG: hypothetical protein JXD19_03360 [Deltaproteobacteria bacterium]|nr:hypothetical protein [Deltaproteobacteria bacterium]
MRDSGFEEIRFLANHRFGLKAILAIHRFGNQNIAAGGCRVRHYRDESGALADAKQLAFTMSLKYQVAGLPFGGLKLVVYAHDESHRKEAFEQIGRWMDEYKGRCYIATDLGSSPEDMVHVRTETPYVLELPEEYGGLGSFIPLLGAGVAKGLEAALDFLGGEIHFDRISAYIVGLGRSGIAIAALLLKRGCTVYGYDVQAERNAVGAGYGVVIRDTFLSDHYDLLIPCATDYTVNTSNAYQIDADIVGGSANAPVHPVAEEILFARGITFIPDFIISSGAILVDDLIITGGTPTIVEGMRRTTRIYDFTKTVLSESKKSGRMPGDIALRLLGY